MFAMSREKAFKVAAVTLGGVGAAGLAGCVGITVADCVGQYFNIHNVVTEFADSALKSGWPVTLLAPSGLLLTAGMGLHVSEAWRRVSKRLELNIGLQ